MKRRVSNEKKQLIDFIKKILGNYTANSNQDKKIKIIYRSVNYKLDGCVIVGPIETIRRCVIEKDLAYSLEEFE